MMSSIKSTVIVYTSLIGNRIIERFIISSQTIYRKLHRTSSTSCISVRIRIICISRQISATGQFTSFIEITGIRHQSHDRKSFCYKIQFLISTKQHIKIILVIPFIATICITCNRIDRIRSCYSRMSCIRWFPIRQSQRHRISCKNRIILNFIKKCLLAIINRTGRCILSFETTIQIQTNMSCFSWSKIQI